MDLWEAIQVRHSVRQYMDRPLEDEVRAALQQTLDSCNQTSGLNIQLCLDEPQAFSGGLARYGKFENCQNYLVLAGPRDRDEDLGYYGQILVLKAQQLGLNSCWVGLNYSKARIPVARAKGEIIRLVIALGYGKTQGRPRQTKEMNQLSRLDRPMPDWFRRGMEAAMLAPTAMNQQKFLLTLHEDRVSAQAFTGFYSRVDLGIVKYHFEIGAGREHFAWI